MILYIPVDVMWSMRRMYITTILQNWIQDQIVEVFAGQHIIETYPTNPGSNHYINYHTGGACLLGDVREIDGM